jgi:hypothetical protein
VATCPHELPQVQLTRKRVDLVDAERGRNKLWVVSLSRKDMASIAKMGDLLSATWCLFGAPFTRQPEWGRVGGRHSAAAVMLCQKRDGDCERHLVEWRVHMQLEGAVTVQLVILGVIHSERVERT